MLATITEAARGIVATARTWGDLARAGPGPRAIQAIGDPVVDHSEALLDVEGCFWAAESPEHRVRGRLQWGRQVGELQLEQLLRVVRLASTDEVDVIHGRSLTGEVLCLADCHVRRLDIAAVQYRQTWTVNATLVGVDRPNPPVRGIEVRSPDLRTFYGAPRTEPPRRRRAHGRDIVDLRWMSSPEIRVSLGGGIEVVFDDDWQITGTASDLSLTAEPRLRVLSDDDATEEELAKVVGPLLVMIGIFSGSPVDHRDLRLALSDGGEARSLNGRRPFVAPVDRPRPWLAIGNLDPLDRTLAAWMTLNEELPRALIMLAEYQRAGAATPWEDRLLYLARFVEQYHRKRRDSLRMPKADFRDRRTRLRDELGGDLGQWAYDLIAHANERSLAERMQELIDELADVVADTLPDANHFGKLVADTRNYYTHYSQYWRDPGGSVRCL